MAILYHSEDDLVEVRPEILNFGVTDFDNRMQESEDIINRVLDAQWYRAVAEDNGVDWRETVFDPTLLLNGETQLKRLSVYKSLQLIYMHLMKESPESDAFERMMKLFKSLYTDELNEVLNAGLDYDWDASGTIDSGERNLPVIRRLQRV